METLSQKQAGDCMVQEVVCLPSKLEALSSTLVTAKRKKKNPSTFSFPVFLVEISCYK
jgi:hypothetical protein